MKTRNEDISLIKRRVKAVISAPAPNVKFARTESATEIIISVSSLSCSIHVCASDTSLVHLADRMIRRNDRRLPSVSCTWGRQTCGNIPARIALGENSTGITRYVHPPVSSAGLNHTAKVCLSVEISYMFGHPHSARRFHELESGH